MFRKRKQEDYSPPTTPIATPIAAAAGSGERVTSVLGPGIAWKGSQVGGFVQGAANAYPGLGAQVAGGCVCKEARFDLDGFGRLYIPNAVEYRVRLVDNAGNEVVRAEPFEAIELELAALWGETT